MDTRTRLPVVGMVGGGQLARMSHQAAISLGQSLRVLAAQPDDGAALVAPDVQIGAPDDLEALRRFAKGCDVVTFDHEHVPGGHVRALVEAGATVHPSADALIHAQDKRVMRERLSALGVPVPRWRVVRSVGAAAGLADEAGWPLVAKAVRGGYDGRGVWLVGDRAELAARLAGGAPLLVEERVRLRRELAVQVARSPFGQVAAYPVVETVQRDGICVEVLAPAPSLPEERAVEIQRLAIGLATDLDVVGLLTVELFETAGGVLVNELAMRPHNSGHWTIEGALTSQFEQHLRAVLDYPLGGCRMAAPAVAMANVLGADPAAGAPDAAPAADPPPAGRPGAMALDERLHHMFAAEPGVKVHLYGKRERPGRKIAHVTALGDDLAEVRARAGRAARVLREGPGG
jgi:5-(carboxyamino)imidazole ribonucleotide synthase